MSFPGEWINDGLCAQTDPDLWFPRLGGSFKQARTICHQCTVIDQCKAYALGNDDTLQGMWAGLTAREIREIKAGRKVA